MPGACPQLFPARTPRLRNYARDRIYGMGIAKTKIFRFALAARTSLVITRQSAPKRGRPPGFPGSKYGPFLIPDRAGGLESVRPPAGMTAGRFERRHALYRDLIGSSPLGECSSDYQKESLLRSMEQAYRS